MEQVRFCLNAETFRVAFAGSAMQSMNKNQQSISNLSKQVESDDAVNKSSVDDFFFMNGASNRISMNNFKIINLAEPTESQEAAMKYYVDQLFNNLREMIIRNDL